MAGPQQRRVTLYIITVNEYPAALALIDVPAAFGTWTYYKEVTDLLAKSDRSGATLTFNVSRVQHEL